MKMRITNLAIFIILIGTISGCASVSAKREFKDVQKQIEARTKSNIKWQSSVNKEEINHQIQSILQNKLTVDDAVQVAVINNPSLQAVFEELGISKTDVVKAGLLTNPIFEGSIRQPSHAGKTNTEFEVRQNILDIIILPLRRKMASQQLEQVKYSVGQAVLKLDSEIRAGYYTFQSAKQMYTMEEKILKAAQSAVELAERQLKAGNINDLVLTGHKMALYQAQMELTQKEAEVTEARENLARLMGLSRYDISWDILEDLPYVSKEETSLKELESKALAMNFDLAAARQEVKVMQKTVSVSRMEIFPDIEAGYNIEKESDGGKLSGPVFEVEVPLFDQKQSSVARAKAELRQSEKRLKALEDEILAEVRSKYAKLIAVKNLVKTYKDTVIPLHAQFLDSLQKHYNFMLVGVYDLLDAKKEEVEAIHKFLENLKEYWVIRSELESLTGERFTFIPEESMESSTMQKDKADMEHMNHQNHGGK
ncbi:MAG: TolC family protein [Candidatus Omnitrophica bacterium]|nr:TolC family protein [Candidatus Omnitrophota bacterium]